MIIIQIIKNLHIFSYPERLRDWPNEVSATGLIEDTVLIPIGDKRLEDEKIVFVF